MKERLWKGDLNMNAKGISYVVTKANMTAAFGEERWTAFMAKLAEKDKYFSTVIMSITPMPIEKLIVFFDEMCKEFFNDDKMQYVKFGKAGAKAVLSADGPYKSFMLVKDIKQFVESVIPKVWTMYFDSGVTIARLENNVAHIKITGLDIKYTYFEYLVMGYFQQAIKMFGKKSNVKRVRSIAAGDEDIYFTYELKDS
jgi:hypothetical protein